MSIKEIRGKTKVNNLKNADFVFIMCELLIQE
jgi:hypothetical protein